MKHIQYIHNILILTLLFLSASFRCSAQDVVSWVSKLYKSQPDTVSILFLGDIMQHGAQLTAAKTKEGYDYLHCFAPLASRLQAAELTVANIETVFAGAPYSGYPIFSSPDVLVPHLKASGIQLFLTANNHLCDQGEKGLKRSIDLFDSTGIQHTGIFRSQEERNQRYPLMVIRKGIRIALLNYSYGTNGFPIPHPYVFNHIDTMKIAEDIIRAQRMQADFIIACMHWGEEYEIKQNDRQEYLAAFLKRKGVDLIIGSHPHVPQGMEVVYNSIKEIQHVVVYSLGNVISNMTLPHTQIGLLVEVKLVKDGFYKSILSFGYEWIATEQRRDEGARRFYTLPVTQCTVPSASVIIQSDSTPLPTLQFRTDTIPSGTIKYTLIETWKKRSI